MHTATRPHAAPVLAPFNGVAQARGAKPSVSDVRRQRAVPVPADQGELFTPGLDGVANRAAENEALRHAAAAAGLQAMLTEVFLQDEPAQRLLALGAVVPAAHRHAWHLVTHTLLARRLALGSPALLQQAADAHTVAWALTRQWEQPVLKQRWQRLISAMTARQCEQLALKARRQLRQWAALH